MEWRLRTAGSVVPEPRDRSLEPSSRMQGGNGPGDGGHQQVPTRSPHVNEGGGAALPGARAALGLLLLINLFNYIDRYILAAVIPSIKGTFFDNGRGIDNATVASIVDWVQHTLGVRLEDALIGLLGTAFMVTYMIAAPVFARLAERVSRWTIVGAGVLLWSLASGASGLAASFVVLFLTRCFVGIGEAAYGPVAPSIISDLYPVEVRGRVLALFYVAIPVGTALGYALGGVVAGSGIGRWAGGLFGVATESWRWAFYVVVIPGAALALRSLFMPDPPRGQADDATSGPRPGSSPTAKSQAVNWRDYAVLLRTPSYVYGTLGMTAMTFALGGISFWMPYYLETRPGHPQATLLYPLFGGITLVAGLTSTLAGGWAGDRLRTRFSGSYFLVSGAAMLVGFPVFLLALHAAFPWIWVLIFIACFCLFFNTGPSNTILANVAPPSIRAAGFALNIFVIHALGDTFSPLLIGLLNDYFGHDMNKSFVVVGIMFVIAGVLWLAGSRHLARDTALATTRLAASRPG